MMTVVLGKPDSGKSNRAEEIVLGLSKPGKRIYLATMIPFGEEGKKRIEKHRNLREGKEFITIECPVDLRSISENALFTSDTKPLHLRECTVLVECVSNLVGNEMHKEGNETLTLIQLSELIFDEIKWLSDNTENLIVVTNEFDLKDDYDKETRDYIELTRLVNHKISELSDHIEIIGNE